MIFRRHTKALAVALLAGTASAIELNINDEQSIKNAAATAAYNTWSEYTTNQTGQPPGAIRTDWAMGGALFDTMIRYWYYSGDASNNAAISEGMYWQLGENNDYMPANWSSYLGNDDQSIWSLAAMTAAELGYPERSSMPSWVTIAENVFNDQIARWDTKTCSGGLRWQIWTYESGYNIKSTLANGLLFELSARLARYTNNQTYSDWADKIWTWSTDTLISDEWSVSNDVDVEDDCGTAGNTQWSFNYGPYIAGTAYMYNLTNGKSEWKTNLDGLLKRTTATFFPSKYGGKILSEVACESTESCNNNEIWLKGATVQDLAMAALVAPYTASDIMPLLQGSAVGAAKSCTGDKNNTECGVKWYAAYDDSDGMPSQLSATSLFTANLVSFSKKAASVQSASTNTTSVTSTGSANGTDPGSSSSAGATQTGTNAASVLVVGPVAFVAAVIAGAVAWL
ncbi:glycoside hydrolase [Penicillium maclennaniae]|uniref:glycoside hydrolase n=1 Tax=Penicillium maclennaniae TaxID=1343394 RepID=UPI00254100AA|nr:glycoside hydrolase [Penicillium maclennaniae]KAJ5668060.1 glycoside hydrolase [Penicillium maclennaniae]